MSIVKVISGDLLSLFSLGDFQVIGHGANCMNLMGAGIAAQVREQFPEAYAADAEFHKRLGGQDFKPCRGMAGHISTASIKALKGAAYVVNMYTQVRTGREADYQLIQSACEKLNKWCKERNLTRVGLPLVGCGIGGLDIIAAMTIINACTPDIDVTIVVYHKDEAAMKEASKFRNYGFPHRFNGLVMRTGQTDFEFYSTSDDKWHKSVLELERVQTMWHNGETAISFSKTSPDVWLLVTAENAVTSKNLSRLVK